MLKHPLVWLIALMGTLLAFAAGTLLQKRGNDLYRHTRDLPEIMHLISQAYVDEVDPVTLMPGAYQGVLTAIDENASYYPAGVEPVIYTDQVYDKFGMVVTRRNDYGYVLAMEADSPAARSGLKRGTYIYKVGQRATRRESLYRIHQLLVNIGKEAELVVMHPNETEEGMLTLKPGKTKPAPLVYRSLANGTHFIGISQFDDQTEPALTEALAKVRQTGGPLILDLRNNARGGENHLHLLARRFLPKGPLAAWVDTKKNQAPVVNMADGTVAGFQLYILVDRGTSLAAETFAAIAQDMGKARIVGHKTQGMPRFYQTIPLKSGAHIQLPSHKLVLPGGKTLTLKGIQPDLEVERVYSKDDPSAEMLEKALDMIREDVLTKAG